MLLFLILRGVWIPPKENTAEIIYVYAHSFANKFSSMLRPVVKSLFKAYYLAVLAEYQVEENLIKYTCNLGLFLLFPS